MYVFILVYQFEYVYILNLRYFKSSNVIFFQKRPYFLISYENATAVLYKISITIYFKYTCILDIHTTLDDLV